MKRRLGWFAVLILLVGGYGIYQYMKPATQTVGIEASATVQANLLLEEYLSNEVHSDRKYLGKVIRVNGEVAGIESNNGGANVSLVTDDPMGLVVCGFSDANVLDGVKVGSSVSLMGFCDGFTGFDVQLSKSRLLE